MSTGIINPSKIKTWQSVVAAILISIGGISGLLFATDDNSPKIYIFSVIILTLVGVMLYLLKSYFYSPLTIRAKMTLVIIALEELADSLEEKIPTITDRDEADRLQSAIDAIRERADSLRKQYGIDN